MFAGLGEILDIRPVTKVFVLSPDNFAEGYKQEDFSIEIKTFKPSQDKMSEELVKKSIFTEIKKLENRYEKIKGAINC